MVYVELLLLLLAAIVVIVGIRVVNRSVFIPRFAKPENAFIRLMRKRKFTITVSRNFTPIGHQAIFVKTWRGTPPQYQPLFDEAIPTLNYVYVIYGVVRKTERIIGISIDNKKQSIPEFAITPLEMPLLQDVIDELFPQLQPIVFPEKEVFNEHYNLKGASEEALSDLIRPELMNYLATLTEGPDRFGISSRNDEVIVYCRITGHLNEALLTRIEQATSEIWQHLQPATNTDTRIEM